MGKTNQILHVTNKVTAQKTDCIKAPVAEYLFSYHSAFEG